MSNHRKHINALVRDVAWTHCPNGPLDLLPITAPEYRAGYLDATGDFEAESYHPTPKFGESLPAWSPGYLHYQKGEVIGSQADLIALTSEGVSASQVHRWLVVHGLTGLVWPTTSSTRARPACCAVLLLASTVDQHRYTQLWLRLAADVFGNTCDPAQADFRHRFDYPRTPNHKSQLLRHDANALPASYGLTLDAIRIGPTTAALRRE